MLAFAGIILLTITIILIFAIIAESKDEKNPLILIYTLVGVLIFLCFLGGILCFQEHFDPSISPMDVYRGKTTLEITYRDSVAIDSTVVYKVK